MSQVAKSASAFVRAFLAILVLELEDMVVRLFRPPKLAGVHGDRWTVRLGISVDIRCRAWRLAWRAQIRWAAEEKSFRAIHIVTLLSTFKITHLIFSSSDAT
jgi:hypothetical protein